MRRVVLTTCLVGALVFAGVALADYIHPSDPCAGITTTGLGGEITDCASGTFDLTITTSSVTFNPAVEWDHDPSTGWHPWRPLFPNSVVAAAVLAGLLAVGLVVQRRRHARGT